jgi:hypothetical protein
VPVVTWPFDSATCASCIIRDPDGNEILLHQKR